MKKAHLVVFLTMMNFVLPFSWGAADVSLFDVSVLYPLPEIGHWDDLISTTTAKNLLPFEVFDHAKFLINQPNKVTYPLMHVIGVRVDPCFMEGKGPKRCQRQIRFVWQPLTDSDHKTLTIDASVHVFFNLNESEFLTLAGQLKKLRNDFTEDYAEVTDPRLATHPLLKKYGLRSPYADQMNSIWLSATAGKSISRMTFMKLKGVQDFWIFGGFDFVGSEAKPIVIPLLEGEILQQEFVNSMARSPNPEQFLGGIFPSAALDPAIDSIISDSGKLDDLTEDQIRSMIHNVADFEHPQKNNPGTIDCVSCHVTNMIRTWADLNFKNLNLPLVYESSRYINGDFNLENLSPRQGQANVLRMFGYFEDQAIVSQRTINESAEAAAAMGHF